MDNIYHHNDIELNYVNIVYENNVYNLIDNLVLNHIYQN